ncbi:hypothetical protein [Moraxella oculi]|uniref:hypothetical protein n=1 Tax=Moraxella oculi TaxID=2940516 RepID=UPI0020130CC9|nr:hypothetical protein [Moraxella sp. Tifton1]
MIFLLKRRLSRHLLCFNQRTIHTALCVGIIVTKYFLKTVLVYGLKCKVLQRFSVAQQHLPLLAIVCYAFFKDVQHAIKHHHSYQFHMMRTVNQISRVSYGWHQTANLDFYLINLCYNTSSIYFKNQGMIKKP